MNTQQDSTEYDDDNAVKFIQNYIPQDLKEKFTDDQINYIIDIVYDFYDSKGLMDENSTDDNEIIDIDEDEMILFVTKNVKKDKILEINPEEITFIVQGELAYCESLNIFD